MPREKFALLASKSPSHVLCYVSGRELPTFHLEVSCRDDSMSVLQPAETFISGTKTRTMSLSPPCNEPHCTVEESGPALSCDWPANLESLT